MISIRVPIMTIAYEMLAKNELKSETRRKMYL